MKKLKLEELGRLSVSEFKDSDKLPVCIVLDNVRSLHNVGSAFRTADAFRMEKIFLTGITGTPPHREIHKTALGSTESVAWEYANATAEVLSRLTNDGYKIILVEQTSESVSLEAFRVTPAEKYAFVFGNEVEGVSEEALPFAHAAVEIPQRGTKHSLNISVCLGIVMWEIAKQFGF